MESSTVSRQTMSRRPPVGRAPRPFQKPLRPRIATPATVTALNKNWPSHILTGIVRLVGPPLFHQRLEIRVALRRQHDADRDEEGAASLLGGEALAFEPERPAAAGPRRNGELDGPVERRYPHLGAERGFIKRHRQIEPDIVAVEREGVMWRDRHGDQEIAGAARASHALAAKPDLLAIGDPGGNLDFDVLARRQPHPLAHAVRRVRQRQSQGRRDISAGAEIVGLKRRAPAAARGAAERLAQNVLEAAKAGSATARRSAATASTAGETFGTEVERLELGLRAKSGAGARAGAAAESLKSLEARLALGIDLAAVECFALVILAEDFIRRIDFGKARRRIGIVLVGVGMQFFRKAPEGTFDVGCTRLAIDAQHLIGISHSPWTPFGSGAGPACPALFDSTMWDFADRPAMRTLAASALTGPA